MGRECGGAGKTFRIEMQSKRGQGGEMQERDWRKEKEEIKGEKRGSWLCIMEKQARPL